MKNVPIMMELTLGAGETSSPLDCLANTLLIKAETSADYTTDLHVKLDNNPYHAFPTGVTVSFGDERNGVIVPDTFRKITVKNTGSASISFTMMIFFGTAVANSNVSLDGTISIGTVSISDMPGVVLDGVSTVYDSQSSNQIGNFVSVLDGTTVTTSGGVSAVISGDASEMFICAMTNDVTVSNSGGYIVAVIKADTNPQRFPIAGETLTLASLVGDATVYVSEVQ